MVYLGEKVSTGVRRELYFTSTFARGSVTAIEYKVGKQALTGEQKRLIEDIVKRVIIGRTTEEAIVMIHEILCPGHPSTLLQTLREDA